MLSNALRLNFCYLKIIHILHPRYHPKIIGHILKKEHVCLYSYYMSNHNENEGDMKNRSHRYNIIRPKSRCGHK